MHNWKCFRRKFGYKFYRRLQTQVYSHPIFGVGLWMKISINNLTQKYWQIVANIYFTILFVFILFWIDFIKQLAFCHKKYGLIHEFFYWIMQQILRSLFFVLFLKQPDTQSKLFKYCPRSITKKNGLMTFGHFSYVST